MKRLDHKEVLSAAYNSVSIDSDEWSICYETNGEVYVFTLDYSSLPCSPVTIALGRKIIFEWLSDSGYGQDAPVTSTFPKIAKKILLLLCVFEKLYPQKRIFDLDQKSLEAWVLAAMYHSLRISETSKKFELLQNPTPYKKGYLTNLITAYKIIHRLYQEGRCYDGPERQVTQPTMIKLLTSDLSALDLEMDEWLNSNNYGSIPFVIANLLMADAIKTIRSLKTKQLLTYFKTIRDSGRLDLVGMAWNNTNSISNYRKSSDIRYLAKKTANEPEKLSSCKILVMIPLHNKLCKLLPKGKEFTFPWPTFTDLQKDHRSAIIAGVIIFLFIMAKRGGEVRPIRAIDINIPPDISDSSTFTTPNFKTNKGVSSTQGVTDGIQESFETLIGLFYTDIKNTITPLFSTLPFLNAPHKPNGRISYTQLCRYLQDYYEEFIVRCKDIVDFDISKLHSNISPHQFRHTFSEFSLRRFDGNVEELVRQAFRHGVHRNWIKNYSEDKLDEDVNQQLNKEYIQELVPRILLDQDSLDKDFVGGMAVFIATVIRPETVHLSPEAFEEYIANLANDFISITPHEYGWCILHKLFKSQAKCSKDGITPSPAGTTSRKCNGCINFCASRKSHLNKQRTIALTHIDFVESSTWSLPELKQQSLLAIRDAQKLFPELQALGEF